MYGTLIPSALDPSLFVPELRCRRKDSALAELVGLAERAGILRHADAVRAALTHRESLGNSSPGRGIAVPSVRSLAVLESRVVVARSRRGLDWDAADESPVHIIAMLLSPAECPAAAHVESVGRLIAVLKPQRHQQRVLEAKSFDAIATLLREALS
jgi:PTS system nitrogen regulatory IIA component